MKKNGVNTIVDQIFSDRFELTSLENEEEIQASYSFENCTFNGGFSTFIVGQVNGDITFKNCSFKQKLELYSIHFYGKLLFESCTIKNLEVFGSSFRNDVMAQKCVVNALAIIDSDFKANTKLEKCYLLGQSNMFVKNDGFGCNTFNKLTIC